MSCGVCVVSEYYCWQCVKRPVSVLLDRCKHCKRNERERWNAVLKRGASTRVTSEFTHREHRAPVELVDVIITGEVKRVNGCE